MQQALSARSYRDLYRSASVRKARLYSPTQAAVGALLGGPLAAVVYLQSNFGALGDRRLVVRTRVLGGLLLLAVIAINRVLPDGWTSSLAVGMATAIATRFVVERFHLSKQAIAESDEFAFRSSWQVLAVAVGCIAVLLAVAMALLLALSA